MDLRQQIKKDFGYELNIGNGLGTSDEPLSILDRGPVDAAVTVPVIMARNREYTNDGGKHVLSF